MGQSLFEKNLYELICRTSTDLPVDVENALRRYLAREKRGTLATWCIETILCNTLLARNGDAPICQDTGALHFYYLVPVGFDTNALVAVTRSAVSRATRQGYLRQNTVDSVFGGSYETNIAPGAPVFHFQQGARKTVDVRLVMKGGGCENMGIQYSLPDESIEAGRDMDGVRQCILDAVWKIQGNGCAPGVLGVCIGGDRTTGYEHSKEQFLRKVSDRSNVKTLARMEARIMKDVLKLGIGPMGLGGRTSLLGVKIGALSRLPACYFVTVSYMCWAFRRRGMVLGPGGGLRRWVY